MAFRLLQIDTFLAAWFLTKCSCQGSCPAGWFGHHCMLMCHCARSGTCRSTDGACPLNDECASEYFGPGCQYKDLCRRLQHQTPGMFNDCSDHTCNTSPNDMSVEVLLIAYTAFQWFRVVVNNQKHLNDFNLTLNGNEPCRDEIRYPVSQKSVDVVCSNNMTLTRLELRGRAAGSICSVHVSIGRNVTLKQQTRQSSNSTVNADMGLSSHAVDGNTYNVLDNTKSCTQTDMEDSPFWELRYNRHYIINKIVVTNRDCPEGHFGTLCDKLCSTHCWNRSCHYVTQKCFGCVDGFKGEYCQLETEKKSPPLVSLPLIISAILLLLGCFIFGSKRTAERDAVVGVRVGAGKRGDRAAVGVGGGED